MSAHDEGRVLHGVRRTVALAKGWLLRGVRVWQVMSGATGTRRGALAGGRLVRAILSAWPGASSVSSSATSTPPPYS
jgi:hypothetical protein